MILTVTPNPAVDITYRTDTLEVGEVHRVAAGRKAGGKGLNVARVIAQRGESVRILAPIGGDTGAFIAQDIEAAGIPATWISQDADTRSTVNVLTEDGESTMLNEPGQQPSSSVWAKLVQATADIATTAQVAVVSGSFPAGLSVDQQRALFAAAHNAPFTIFDVSGPLLLEAARAGATVLKPNKHELLDATESATVAEGIQTLLGLGAQAVAVSLGAEGLLFATPKLQVRGSIPAPLTGNPTGAGDAAVASLALSLARHDQSVLCSPEIAAQAVRDAVVLSAAAVIAPTAGAFDLPTYEQLLSHAETEVIDATR